MNHTDWSDQARLDDTNVARAAIDKLFTDRGHTPSDVRAAELARWMIAYPTSDGRWGLAPRARLNTIVTQIAAGARWDHLGYIDRQPCRRHLNPDGTVGGFVAFSAHVSTGCHVGPDALVLDTATVTGLSRVVDTATVGGNASIGPAVTVAGHANVTGTVRVRDGVRIDGNAIVSGDGRITDQVRITDRAVVGDSVWICGRRDGVVDPTRTLLIDGDARVFGTASIHGAARITDSAQVFDSAQVSDDAVISGHAIVSGYSSVSGCAVVTGWARVHDNAEVGRDERIEGVLTPAERAQFAGTATGGGSVGGRAELDVDVVSVDAFAH